MWCMVMFDLPTDTREARKAAHDFREMLLDDGFVMMQYSVYSRHCGSSENLMVHEKRVKTALPKDGEVRILNFTDAQFARMKIFLGRMRKASEKGPEQLTFL